MKYLYLQGGVFLLTLTAIAARMMDQVPQLTSELGPVCVGCAIFGLAMLGLYLAAEIKNDMLVIGDCNE